MRALDLSEKYFWETAAPSLADAFPELWGRLAVGLVGNGSECFGYDDELSRDHDWGVEFYLWTTEGDWGWLSQLRKWKRRLWETNPPSHLRRESGYAKPYDPATVGDFYQSLIGSSSVPGSVREWVRTPEEQFAMAVNGRVFMDRAGEFTAIREGLLGYVPEDLRKKRLAACCMALAQTGQYNLARCAKRGDVVTAHSVISRFLDSAIAAVFLLNRTFRPYYKWAYRRMGELPLLGGEVSALLRRLAEVEGFEESAIARRVELIEKICAVIAGEIRRQELATAQGSFLTILGQEIQQSIEDPALRALPPQYNI